MRKTILLTFATAAALLCGLNAWGQAAFLGAPVPTNAPPGGWTPLSESSLQAWYDASSNTNLTNSTPANPTTGNQISFWRDSSPNGRTATGEGAPNPTWIASVQNGLGVTRYAGANEDFVATAVGAVFAVNNPALTCAIVGKFGDLGVSHIFWDMWGTGGQSLSDGKTSADLYDYLVFDGTTAKRDTAGSTDNSFHTYIVISTGTTVTAYKDGTQVGSAGVDVALNMNQLNNFRIGGNSGGGGGMNGDIGEIQIYNSSAPTLANMQGYLKAKWNTP